MADEIYLGNKTYVSSKRAAKACGYAQDYVGQLARGGLIDAQRVAGLWYVSMESLEAYKRNAEAYVPSQPGSSGALREVDTIVTFDGKDYVSAAKAAKLTGYHPDYVGQLARGGKILSRQVGNRWYIERSGLVAHKSQKDALLAAVQAESVGLQLVSPNTEVHAMRTENADAAYLTYIREEKSLLPVLNKTDRVLRNSEASANRIPIRVAARSLPQGQSRIAPAQQVRRHGITKNTAVKSLVALTVVIVMSYGFTSIKSESLYAFLSPPLSTETSPAQHGMAAAASEALEMLTAAIESLVVPEITYIRGR